MSAPEPLVPRYGRVDPDYATTLMSTAPDDDGPVWMVNLMKYREKADYQDGRDDDISGREADDRYTPFGPLRDVGAEIVFAGDVCDQLLGDEPRWDRIGVVRYPTRRAFMDMQTLPEFQELHHHKDAGMEQTIIIGGQPIDVPSFAEAGVEPPEWDDVPHPPTEDDGPVMVLHVLRYKDAEAAERTPAEMEAYQSAAARSAVPNGVRIAGWFAAEGTIVGDGRRWDQVRFNAFPSREAFMAVALDPARLEAQKDHREVAIADTYTMIVRPFIDTLADSIER